MSAPSEIPTGLAGLSSIEARRRLAQIGPNRWVKRDRLARFREVIGLLLDPMAVMLAVAAGVYFLLGETRDAVVLAIALIPVLGVDVLLEARSRTALERLARVAAPFADVVREQHVVSVPIEEVVPDDVLALREGHVIAADGVVRWAANLAIDESSLTGESEPQSKREWPSDSSQAPPDARFFAGSQVVAGHGFGLVITTGTATQYGGIAALVGQTASSASPLQQQAAALVRRLGIVAIIMAVALFALSLARGEPWTRALLGAVSLAMAAIPEEFPIVLTLFLSVGAWRLASRGMLVRHLASVETLGATTVICTDKTGTLTRGEFQMTQHLVLEPGVSERDFLEAAVLACERHPTDAMESAIGAYARARGVAPSDLETRWTLVRDYDFDPIGKHMSHVWHALDIGDTYVIAAKGAVEGILAHSEPDEGSRRRVIDANDELARHGQRVLALAARRTSSLGASREEDERDLTVYGLLGFQDPLRPEVPRAVAECQDAGIRITMITGDHALTAHAVAEAAGILHDDDLIVTGDELAALSERERTERIRRAAIFARISPEQKFLIVDGMKRAGAIVAMTGDGVNDAPALHRADIGIAMGQRGTDVARATADLVLLDDNFASIVDTIRQGRHIFQNIQRAFLYLIAFHIPIIALAIWAPLIGVPLVLLPIHLVWLELIVHPVSAVVFQAEPAAADIMTRPPRDPAASLLPRAAVMRSAVSGGVLAVASFAMYWWQWPSLGEAQARALALVVLLAGYQILVFAERLALPALAVEAIPRTFVFWAVWCASALSLIVILYIPAAAQMFRVVPPKGSQIAAAIVVGMAAVGWRLILRRPQSRLPAAHAPLSDRAASARSANRSAVE
ncbi:MAG: cation-transporting P-type ATPase [Acidobacteria bacterium]|nr:MAG: cation-transporting P-type ATPase [Acidobacteriota bacterium]